jgi:hypothetical protein
MHRHLETFLEVKDLGRSFPPYAPTFPLEGLFIDEFHHAIGDSAKGAALVTLDDLFRTQIKGWLRRADALKLYEMAFFAPGDILELGSYHGLSTCILSRANLHSTNPRMIQSIDLSPGNCAKTSVSLKAARLDQNVTVSCAEASEAVKQFASRGQRFSFVFIDHSHSYRPVKDVCLLLPQIVTAEGFCLFHDFNDRRNGDPEFPDYGVYQAVIDNMSAKFTFYGVYGCTALYRALPE